MNYQGLMTPFLACVLVFGAGFSRAAASGVPISRAYLHSDNNVRIVYRDGKELRVPKEEDQVSCESFAVAADGEAAGWLVDYPDPGATYAIPMTLVVFRAGKVLRRINNGFVIARWAFLQGGAQVAYSSNTAHGDRAPYYELRDLASDRVVDSWRGPLNEKSPEWARRVANRE
jgi:hypothetical protein